MLLFSDLHLHASHPVVGQDYLNIGINSLRQIREFAMNNNEKTVIHLGDVFQLKDRIPSRVWNAFFNELIEWERAEIKSFWLKGNHDFAMETTIEAFKISPYAFPSSGTYFSSIGRCKLYVHSLWISVKMKSGTELLFIHDYFKGKTLLPNGIVSSEGIDIPKNGTFVFAGHSHRFQKIADWIWHIGSPYQVNFNEIGQEKFFAQINENGIKFHKFSYPEFKIVSFDRINYNPEATFIENPSYINSYIKLIYDMGKHSDKEMKEFKENLFKMGALGVKLEPVNTNVVKHRVKAKGGEKVDYFREYIEARGEGFDRGKLYQVGYKIMKGGE